MANTAYFDLITEGISVPLSILASGYKPDGLINDKVFPVVKSILKSGKIPIFSKDNFRIYQTLRARGAHSNRAQISADSWIDFYCEEHDLAIPLDQRELNELNNIPDQFKLNALFNLENRTRRRVQWNLALEQEKVVADMVQNTSNYDADHVVTLAGDGSTAAACWSGTGGDPVSVIETAREEIRATIGIYPNWMFYGTETYAQLKFHASYTDKMKLTNDKVVRPELICAMHDIPNYAIGMSMGLDTDDAFVDLWGDFMLLAWIPTGTTPDLDEPSFGYTIKPGFSESPYPYVDVFTEEGGKIVNIRCTDMYDQIMVMKGCGYIIKNTKQ
jgi:hypothetical protein